ncbi:MAG: hypothetical protein VX335_03110 [Pseudomonadota bacterium]|nr:hypothetical protein [Pseudomonadota bacterium]
MPPESTAISHRMLARLCKSEVNEVKKFFNDHTDNIMRMFAEKLPQLDQSAATNIEYISQQFTQYIENCNNIDKNHPAEPSKDNNTNLAETLKSSVRDAQKEFSNVRSITGNNPNTPKKNGSGKKTT